MKYTKHVFLFTFPLLIGAFQGCTTVKYYPVNFVESLKHPTKFPEVFSFTVQDIEEIVAKNPLSENEDTRITDVSENKNSSMHLIQVRENGELHPHYHKRHDEVIYIKKGSGIATLDGTRYMIKPGSILQIPSKTVHKFLNTGEEPLIAISIFSPPFDGRDEKSIRKKKANRDKKEERRLASKKPEKVVEEDKNPAEEPPEQEMQTAADNRPRKVAEKGLNKPARNEWEADFEEPSLPLKKPSTPKNTRDKKKIKEAGVAEEPAVNIRDLHEKLTKLLELKEEGTITEEEYEKKKDALVKGMDIGELPGVKVSARKKPAIEDDDEPVPEQVDKDIPAWEDIFGEDEDATTRNPYASGKDNVTAPETGSIERTSSLDNKLKTLEELRQEGLITEEEYEEKRGGLIGISKKESASVPTKNIAGNEKIKELDELYDEGLITEEDYESKRKELLNQTEEEVPSLPSQKFTDDERIDDLRELYNEGLITEDDYKYKVRELTDTQEQKSSPNVIPGKMNDEMLTELNELKEQGLISEEDYEFKKAQLQDN